MRGGSVLQRFGNFWNCEGAFERKLIISLRNCLIHALPEKSKPDLDRVSTTCGTDPAEFDLSFLITYGRAARKLSKTTVPGATGSGCHVPAFNSKMTDESGMADVSQGSL